MRPLTHYEFFCGGGMARLGLGPGWTCAFANDLDPMKCAAYRANFAPAAELSEGDVHALTVADLPGRADLAWASFPCQDLSLAGARGGLKARRSGAFWGFWSLMAGLRDDGRAPRTIVIENVSGFGSSNGGRDLALVLETLAAGGYVFDVRMLDAAAFLPQSRPRLFIIAWDAAEGDGRAASDGDHPATAHARRTMSAGALAALRHLETKPPCGPVLPLATVMEDAPLFADDRAQSVLDLMAPLHRARLHAAQARAIATRTTVWGMAYRRMRAGQQRLEIRFDRAGCLRTPAGGSSRQIVVRAGAGGQLGVRHLTGREAARLMGLPDTYTLPSGQTAALKLCGDGVAVPVVTHIAQNWLLPLLGRSLQPALEPVAAAE